MAPENISSLEVPPETVDLVPEGRTFGWGSLVRAIARVPLPIRAKQLFGTFAVAALLALVAVLGLVALGQSNSRGTELRRLQQQGAYEQLLLTDATQLKQLIDLRLLPTNVLNNRPSRSDEPDLRAFDPASYQRGFLSALDQQVGNEFRQLCSDAGADVLAGSCLKDPRQPLQQPPLPLTLNALAPSLYRKLEGVAGPSPSPREFPPGTIDSAFDFLSLFQMVSGASGVPQGPYRPFFVRADVRAASFAASLAVLTGKTQARANALAATDRRSYSHS